MSPFSFSFAGDDIDNVPSTENNEGETFTAHKHAAETGSLRQPSTSAFPIAGQSLLPPQSHDLTTMLRNLPSKIAYSTLEITLDNEEIVRIPRRELWDIRLQLMAEEDDESLRNLREVDVKTGIYEGGFKSWESSVDLVRLLNQSTRRDAMIHTRNKVLELGCGTALPSLSIFQWFCRNSEVTTCGLDIGLADYNPTVLQLVTLPNIVLSWAQSTSKSVWERESELEVDEGLLMQFLAYLEASRISISFFSGAWGSEFVCLVKNEMSLSSPQLTIIGAETIYSPFALASFADSLVDMLEVMPDAQKIALVAAKAVYFGVGGSMEDFRIRLRGREASSRQLRVEADGIKREVVEVKLTRSKA